MKTLKTTLSLCVGLICMILTLSVSANAATTIVAVSASARLANAGTVTYTATLAGIPASDDGMVYLYALQPYEYAISAADPCVGTAPLSLTPTFSFGLNGMICNKFALAVKIGGVPVMIANAQYITNPEVAATRTRAPQNVGFVEPYEKMVLYRIGEVDPNLCAIGNYSTAVIVNKANPNLINPYALVGDKHPVSPKMYYALNAANATGVQTLQSTMSNFAAVSHVDEFIIGNEVNNRKWNYMAYMDWDSYIREYAQAFRVAYNAIKSTNANARVLISLDQNWDRNRPTSHGEYYEYLDVSDFLIKFNAFVCMEGNIDWGLAAHPYPTPLTYAKFWDYSGCPNGAYYQRMIATNAQISFQNLPVLTSFMQQPGMLSPNGGVRYIILPEIGLTSAQGYEVQAAAYVACYTACRNNPCIKRIYFHRMNEGGALNFGTAGISEQVYQSLIAGGPGQYDAWAKSYIGIADWHQVVSY